MFSKSTWVTIVPVTIGLTLYYVLRNAGIFRHYEPVVIETGLGKIQGVIDVSRDGRPYISFTGIPYAQPPIRKLRFQPPVDSQKWEGILDATHTIPDCTQFDPILKIVTGQEDCLYLNIYTPQITGSEDQSKLPVIFYIHGGHFMFSGSGMVGPQYFMDFDSESDVVLVTMNYRLGALGFLNTGDGEVAGNMGLKDQNKALQWVRENIQYFGGDKDRVTLMGHSAGGASVEHHILSPMSKGLFQKAVSMSGSSLCPWGFTRDPKAQAIRLGKQLSCPTHTSKELVECLLAKSALEIAETQRDIGDVFHVPEAIYAPSIENPKDKKSGFLIESPTEILRAGKAHKVPFITGVSSEEGCYRSPLVLGNPDKISKLNNEWEEVAPNTFLLYNASSSQTLEQIRTFYFGKEKPEIGFSNLDNLTNAYSDRYFVSCVKDAAVLHSKYAPTFLYHVNHEGDFALSLILSSASTTTGPVSFFLRFTKEVLRMKLYNFLGWKIENYGCCHGDDILEIFQWLPFLRISKESSIHYQFSKDLVKLWKQFASADISSNKVPKLEFNGVVWEPIAHGKTPKYLNLGTPLSMIDEPFTNRLEFWKKLNLPNN